MHDLYLAIVWGLLVFVACGDCGLEASYSCIAGAVDMSDTILFVYVVHL